MFINKFPLYGRKNPLYDIGTDAFYSFGMGKFIAREFHRRNSGIEFENWRIDSRISVAMTKRIEGVNCRVFPADRFSLKVLNEFSLQMIKALYFESKNGEVIFHFMGVHDTYFNILSFFCGKKQVVGTHLGGPNPLWKYYNSGSFKAQLFYLMEKYIFLKNWDHFITICKEEAKYFVNTENKVHLMPIFGLAYESELIIQSRKSVRKKLNLPLNKKIILQVGRAVEDRGFDWIMNIIEHYSNMEEYLLLFIGVEEEDGYFDSLIATGVHLEGDKTRSDLVSYFNAADILIYLPHDEINLAFAGTSYVPLEALACGTPVVATTFHHFPGEEVKEVSRIPQKMEDVIPMIEDLLEANVSRERCREIVLKYFSWDEVLKKLWEIYNQKH